MSNLSTKEEVLVHGMSEIDGRDWEYPIEVRPSFTLHNHGHGVAFDKLALIGLVKIGLQASPCGEVLLSSFSPEPAPPQVQGLRVSGVPVSVPSVTPTPLASAMERITQCAQGNSSFPWVELSRNEAAALLARLEAAERRIEELAPAAECWAALSAIGRMKLVGGSADHTHIGLELWISHPAKGDAQDLEARVAFCDFICKALAAYRARPSAPNQQDSAQSDQPAVKQGGEVRRYAPRDIRALGQRYADHMLAMTSEDLVSKGDVAAELAWRDWQIECRQGAMDRLQLALTAAQQRIATMRAKLLELAGECAECGGSGSVMSKRGVIEHVPCPDCLDIREAAGVRYGEDGE